MAHSNRSRILASELRAELARRQINTSQLARMTGMIPSTVSRKLLGQSEFTFDELVAIAEALSMSVSELVGMADAGSAA